jgi:putative sugar O-methyltransferase
MESPMTLPPIDERIREMVDSLGRAPEIVRPSLFWQHWNAKNLGELHDFGYENFKRTLARNYFTWVVLPQDPQVRFLLTHVAAHRTAANAVRAIADGRHEPMGRGESLSYSFVTRQTWDYAERHDRDGLLPELHEPLEGNPLLLRRNGRMVTQDIANTLLEYYAMAEGVDFDNVQVILELGAGYGRVGWLMHHLLEGRRYIIADIPPALAVSERYLSSVLPEKRVFAWRDFTEYADVAEEFEVSEVAFLLPHQISLLPSKSVDLFINISSLHEMRPDQITHYLGEAARLTRRYAYLKQWLVSVNPQDGLVIKEHDYPIPSHWKRIYHRRAAVQASFFESLYSC